MFNPGETIQHDFVVPFLKEEIQKAIITYRQNDHIVFEKTAKKSEMSNIAGSGSCIISYSLTELQSLNFEDNSEFTAQVNILTTSGSRHTSNEVKSRNGVQYVREVIKNA